MKKRAVFLVGALSLIGTLYSSSARAECVDEDESGWFCYPPWEWNNDNIETIVGTDPNWYNTQWVGWHNIQTDQCDWAQIGDSNGFYSNGSSSEITLIGYYGDDMSWISDNSGSSFCGYVMAPPIYGGGHVSYDMAWYDGGYDYVWNNDYPSNMYGNSSYGNSLNSHTVSGGILGGGADDVVMVDGTGLFPWGISTYGGNDTVYLETWGGGPLPTTPPLTNLPSVSCGDGSSDYYCGPATKPSDCEYLAGPCG